MIQLTLQVLAAWSSGMILALRPYKSAFSERIVAIIGVVSVPQNPEQIVESCLFSQERIQQRIGCRLSTFPFFSSEFSPSPSRLKNFLVRRARVRGDPGRSPQIELEPERSF